MNPNIEVDTNTGEILACVRYLRMKSKDIKGQKEIIKIGL